MKRSGPLLSLLLILGLVYYSFYSLMPQSGTSASISATEFSTERALILLKEISKAPHYYGSEEHNRVRDFLESELKNLGLETQIQEGYVLDVNSKNLDKPKNIIGRLKGSDKGKSLVLLSHYDSALVPSFGASDAGSGVVTILESLRAYLASGKIPKNDIIILFTDCEEIELDGAKLFVNEHPWAKNVGFVMNFEARGSGGPSVMILESNGGNGNLIKSFIKANPKYPVASSLMYSVYKILPNSTDSTIFRVDGDIDSFFFAFIDDHFDYHTSNDTVENLDIKTLQHQGSYLLPLLHYFADADLDDLGAEEDYVYVNFPVVKMISYPFSWILPMLIIAIGIFILLIAFGIKLKKLSSKEMAKGFLPLLISLVLSGILGYFGWVLLLKIYPQYHEIQHGFKYNGHSYIGVFVFMTLAILFRIYGIFSKKENLISYYIAPLTFWIIVNIAVSVYLKGAGFFIIPVFFGLLSLALLLWKEKPNIMLMVLFGAPAILLFAPLVQFFPVALGSEMVVISCIFIVLLFGILHSVFGFYKNQTSLSNVCILVAVIFFISAHFKSDFSESRQKPNSLLYYKNADTDKTYWVTYDKILDDWTKKYLGESPQAVPKDIQLASRNKYKTVYTYASETPKMEFPEFETTLQQDTILGNYRNVTFTILPRRTINQIGLYADKNITFHSLSYNGKSVPKDSTGDVYTNRKDNNLLRFYVADKDSLEISYSILKDTSVAFTVIEYSFDLLSNKRFSIVDRPLNSMPKPFVITDAIAVQKTIIIDSLKREIKGSVQNSRINE